MCEYTGERELGSVARFEMGQSPPSTVVRDGLDAGVPFLQGNAEFGSSFPAPKQSCLRPPKTCQINDVLISVRAPVGAINVADRQYCIGRGLAAVRFTEIDGAYGAHALRIASSALHRVAQGTTFEAIGKRELERLSIWVPRLEEQRLIAEVLDTVDEAIRKTEEIIAKLKQVKQGLLHDLLTRGIDENGELRDPDRHPEQFKDSPLGRIPKAWEVRPLAECGELVTGTTPPSSAPDAWGEALPFITPAEIDDEGVIAPTERWISRSGTRYVRVLPAQSTLVVCIGSTLGKVGLVRSPCATNQQINAVVPNSDVEARFLAAVIRHNIVQLHRWAGLQAVPIVNKTQFGRMLVPMAPLAEQYEIAIRLSASDNRLRYEHRRADKFSAVKRGLMEDLLTGSVRVTPFLDEAAR